VLILSLFWRRFIRVVWWRHDGRPHLSVALAMMTAMRGADRALPLVNPTIVSLLWGSSARVGHTDLGTRPRNEKRFDAFLLQVHTGVLRGKWQLRVRMNSARFIHADRFYPN